MAKNKKNRYHLPLPFRAGIIALALGTVVLFFYLSFLAYYYQRIYPGIKVAYLPLGGHTLASAHQLLSEEFQKRAKTPLILTYQGQTFTLNLADSSPSIDLGQKILRAYQMGRSGNYLVDLKEQGWAVFSGTTLFPQVTVKNPSALNAQLGKIDQVIKKKPQDARIILGETITLNPSVEGQKLDQELFKKQLTDYLSLKAPPPMTLPLQKIPAGFTTPTAEKYQQVLEAVKTRPLNLTYQSKQWTIDHKVLFKLLTLEDPPPVSVLTLPQTSSQLTGTDFSGTNLTSEEIGITIDQTKLAGFLKEVSQKIDQQAQDAKFSAEKLPNGQIKVVEFQSAREGRKVDIEQTARLISQALFIGSSQGITLPVTVTQPKITNADVNNLGINQLIGQGVSSFTGSITNRIYNIGLADSRLNGILIPPGETFSFLETVGDISAVTGYKQAYIIKSGRTVLDDGGGVCQVSTTVFRVALNTGLPILERTAHAYRVSYYEQGGFKPGLDATVFYPGVDLKFKNDTPAHILIQAYILGNNLYVDLYGTSDGRVATVTTPKILSQTPPLPEIRQDDPTLPKGEIKQVDWPAWGAKVTFSRTVTRGGETLISEAFDSNYRPWQAVYLVGTKE